MSEQDPSKDIIVFRETSPTIPSGQPLMERLGFSVDLPEKLRAMNEVLSLRAPSLKEVEIELTPDSDNPILSSKVEFGKGYRLKLNVKPNASPRGTPLARLEVSTTDDTPALTLKIDDVKDFFEKVFPGQGLKISAKDYRDGIKIAEVDLSKLEELSSTPLGVLQENEELFAFDLGIKNYEFRSDHQAEPAMSLKFGHRGFIDEDGERRDLLLPALQHVVYRGTPEETEEVMEIVKDLFNKRRYYPHVQTRLNP